MNGVRQVYTNSKSNRYQSKYLFLQEYMQMSSYTSSMTKQHKTTKFKKGSKAKPTTGALHTKTIKDLKDELYELLQIERARQLTNEESEKLSNTRRQIANYKFFQAKLGRQLSISS